MDLVWPAHVAVCEEDGVNPYEDFSIVHIDAYKVHTAEEF